jgi:tetratricopeptide (TPR) repeat protein
MILLPEIFWVHQHAYMPLAIGMALAAALGILTLRDVVLGGRKLLGDIAVASAVVVIAGFGAVGLNQYYNSRHYPPEVINMFRRLNQEIPSNEVLAAFFNHVYQESPSKPAFYRPEVAWYLDREIVTARTVVEIAQLAADRRSSFYLAEVPPTPPALVEELKRRYPFEHFKGTAYQAGLPVISYHPEIYLLDLRHPVRSAEATEAKGQGRERVLAGALLSQSLQDYRAGRFKECMDAARQAATVDPSFAEAFNNVGFCAGKLQLWDEAIRNTKQAIRLDPDFQLAKNNLAWLQKQRLKVDGPKSK